MHQNKLITPKEIVLRLFELAFASETLNIKQISALVSADYMQYVDGVLLNREMFFQHLIQQRKKIARINIEFIAIIAKETRVFTHHLVTAIKSNGDIVKVQVLAKFGIIDNKILLCDELTELMQGATEDRNLGSILN